MAFVALVPLLWGLHGARPRSGATVGLLFGLVYNGILLYWLLPFGVIAWAPLVLLQSLYVAGFGAIAPRLLRWRGPVASSAAAAALWTALEWLRGMWPLGGFTWGGLGYTQHGNRLLLPIASVFGVWAVTFVVLFVNAVLASLLRRPIPRRAAVGALATAVALSTLPVLIPLQPARGEAVDVAVVQGNVPRELRHDRLLQSDVVGRNHIQLHRTLAADPPDLAVWPENALDRDPTADPTLGAAVHDAIAAVGSPSVVGAITIAPAGRFYNQALVFDGDGTIVDRYTKQHLVPFGEYVPFRPILGWADRYRPTQRDLAPGDRVDVFDIGGVRVATPICFENVFPDLFRRFVAAGAEVVILTTNDSSFLETVASEEHVIMSQLRAVETGRWVVQAAVSGHSAVIDPTGRVLARTGLFEQTVLRSDVPSSSVTTPYTRWGDVLPLACTIVLAVAAAAAWLRRPRRAAGPGPVRERREPAAIAGAAEPRVLVVLPTYNERDTVGEVLEGILAVGPHVEALVIDDGSPDRTAAVVEERFGDEPRVTVLRRPRKLGLASAYLTGFRRALDGGHDLVVEMDADLSHRPEDLARLLDGAKRFDLTIGSRYVRGGGVTNWSRIRLGLSRAGNAYARMALRLPVSDATSGYRVYRRPVLEELLRGRIRSDGYAFQIELAYRAWRAGFRLGEVPITFREREHGQSKLSRRIVVEAVILVAAWGIRDRLSPTGRR